MTAVAMTDYRCRQCGRWLLESDEQHGRLRTVCPVCNTSQWVFLGGFHPRAKADECAPLARCADIPHNS
jgi:DNA-directed RNA polymerase subunit RPC12/RpoP